MTTSLRKQLSLALESKSGVAQAFAGAPLDLIKLIAAALMVVDHVNYVFLGHTDNVLWYLGRATFPLFAFTTACHLLRGADLPGYVRNLILLGIVSQPIFANLLSGDEANILFTLAAGAVVAATLRSQHPAVPHLAFFAGVATIFIAPSAARSGVDFGLAGILLPAALLLVLEGRRVHMVWLIVLLFGLNWYPIDDPWKLQPIRVCCTAGALAVVVALGALCVAGRPRFLPRYALHVFYPGHLLALMIIHHWV